MLTVTKNDYRSILDADVRQDIIQRLANHTIAPMHIAGLYRHWKCCRPGTWNYGFHIVTWPGNLCYTGDMGDYLFQRIPDMVEFMRGSAMSYSYAAEKCVAHDGRLKEFRPELFEDVLREEIAENPENKDKIEEIRREYRNYENPHDAIKAMYESGLWSGGDIPNCEVYTYNFLFALHAIKWFCDKVAESVSPDPPHTSGPSPSPDHTP